VYGDVDRLLNQMIGLVLDRFDIVADEIGLEFASVLLGFDLELCKIVMNWLVKHVSMVLFVLAVRLCAKSLID
jgi:hypothetical protein